MKENKLKKGIARMMTPQFVVCLVYFLRYRTKMSHRAEVDLTSNLVFGDDCVVGSFTKIKSADGPVHIGNRGGFANGCFVAAGAGGIHIGDNFICGPNVNIVGVNYDYSRKNIHLEDTGVTSKGIHIGNNVWLGAGCTVVDGAVIGDNTIVVANSLVNRRYKDDVILQGAPAKVILKR
jgi:acetyltransferase-like isoleucine patch superfamily enzyme